MWGFWHPTRTHVGILKLFSIRIPRVCWSITMSHWLLYNIIWSSGFKWQYLLRQLYRTHSYFHMIIFGFVSICQEAYNCYKDESLADFISTYDFILTVSAKLHLAISVRSSLLYVGDVYSLFWYNRLWIFRLNSCHGRSCISTLIWFPVKGPFHSMQLYVLLHYFYAYYIYWISISV